MGNASFVFDSRLFHRLKVECRKLRMEERPTRPMELWHRLKEAHEYPHEGLHWPPEREAHDQGLIVVAAYGEFCKAAKNLHATLINITPDWFMLGEALFQNNSEAERTKLRWLEEQLPFLSDLPELHPGDRRPKKIKDAYAESIALVVCFYCRFDEGQARLRTQHTHKEPIGRESVIFDAVLKGLGYRPEATTATRIRSASERILAMDSADDWLKIVQEVGFALRQ